MNGGSCCKILCVQTVGNRGTITVLKFKAPYDTAHMSRSDYTDTNFVTLIPATIPIIIGYIHVDTKRDA